MMDLPKIPHSEWKWGGVAAHLIVANDCRFHMVTQVGDYIVSSIGDYRPASKGGEMDTIGHERFYETYVFPAAEPHPCGCPQVSGYEEIDALPANDCGEATRNHMAMCLKWAGLAGEES